MSMKWHEGTGLDNVVAVKKTMLPLGGGHVQLGREHENSHGKGLTAAHPLATGSFGPGEQQRSS